MKASHALIGTYLLIGVLTGIYNYNNGPSQYDSLAFNIGGGLVWPVKLFKEDPEIDGDSEQSFASSLVKIVSAYPTNRAQILLNNSLGLIGLEKYVDSRPNLSQQEIKALMNNESVTPDFLKWALKDKEGITFLRDEIDGYDLNDIIEAGQDSYEEVQDMMEDRPEKLSEAKPTPDALQAAFEEAMSAPVRLPSGATAGGEPCYEARLAAFRAEMGEEPPVSYDMINEWRGECQLPPE